jgi:glucose/arabinose dehydrogenase
MEGLAIHPDFYSGKPYVYLAYVYKTVGTACPANPASPCYFRSKIVRCQFYFAADAGNPSSVPKKDTLVILDTIISNLPGSNDHNSGRMVISPTVEADGTYKLYYTIGDMGAGQFNNLSRTNNAQNMDTVEGKILRLNTEPDGVPTTPIHLYDKWREWIPNDNPFHHSVFTTVVTPIYSYGHRNAQGLVFGKVNNTWRLYSSEHGDKSDDELNVIQSGKNYGWPKVAGLCDDNYNTTDGNANNDQLAGQNVTNENATFCSVTPNFQRPLFSFFNWAAASIPSSAANIFNWPTIAPSGIDFYNGNIPGWKNSILVSSLKYGMYRMKLKSTGDFVDSTSSSNTVDTFPLLHSWRVRDLAIDPDPNSGVFWVVIDSTGSTSGPTGGFSGASVATKDGGKVLKLTYKTLMTLPIRNTPRSGPPVVNNLVRIFPNPVHNTLYVHGKKELHKPLRVQLYDVYGRIMTESISYQNDFSINVANFVPGTYVLKLYNGYDLEVQVEKIIKQ